MIASANERTPSHGIIVILLPCLLTGGTEVATLETAQAFRLLGYAVEVVVYFDEIDSTMLNTFQRVGLAVHSLGLRRTGGFRTHARLALRLLKVLASRRYQAIWLQYMTPTLLPVVVARIFTRNLIATVHVAASHYSPAGLSRLRLLARHWCARVVCVSHTVANGIFEAGDDVERFAGRVVVIPNALNMTAMQAAVVRDWRVEAGWPREVVVLGFAGRLAHIKGVDVLLHAAARLHRLSLPVRLVVVGEGAEQASLKALAQQLGIGAITYFAGRLPRAEIYGAIKGFDIAAVPSREEGFGLSALEAMAAAVPVVASRVNALQEVVLVGVTGLLCEVDEPASLADALAQLVGNAGLRQSLGTAGTAHVGRLYDAPAYRARLTDLLASLGLPSRSAV